MKLEKLSLEKFQDRYAQQVIDGRQVFGGDRQQMSYRTANGNGAAGAQCDYAELTDKKGNRYDGKAGDGIAGDWETPEWGTCQHLTAVDVEYRP